MTTNHIPTERDVRLTFAYIQGELDIDDGYEPFYQVHEEEFDRFMREVRAKAWDEGKHATAIATYKLIELEENNPNATMGEMNALEPLNPYRDNE